MKYKFLAELEKGVADKLVTKRKHTNHDIYIYNYTQSAMSISPGAWPEWLRDARGLVLDSDGNVVARAFKKFFNLDLSDKSKWDQPFTVTEKVDGSMLMVFWYNDELIFATRGSFESEQSIRAKQIWLNHGYTRDFSDITMVFEVIYPDNRIVVDYGNEEDLIYLASFNLDGTEATINAPTGCLSALQVEFESIAEMVESYQPPNEEGYVIRFADGSRAKFKFEQYVALHRARFLTSNRSIWEALKSGVDPLAAIPMEDIGLREWVRYESNCLRRQYTQIHNEATHAAISIGVNIYLASTGEGDSEFRKRFAIEAKKYKYPSLLFSWLDNKHGWFKDGIWKVLYPSKIQYFRREPSE